MATVRRGKPSGFISAFCSRGGKMYKAQNLGGPVEGNVIIITARAHIARLDKGSLGACFPPGNYFLILHPLRLLLVASETILHQSLMVTFCHHFRSWKVAVICDRTCMHIIQVYLIILPHWFSMWTIHSLGPTIKFLGGTNQSLDGAKAPLFPPSSNKPWTPFLRLH